MVEEILALKVVLLIVAVQINQIHWMMAVPTPVTLRDHYTWFSLTKRSPKRSLITVRGKIITNDIRL